MGKGRHSVNGGTYTISNALFALFLILRMEVAFWEEESSFQKKNKVRT